MTDPRCGSPVAASGAARRRRTSVVFLYSVAPPSVFLGLTRSLAFTSQRLPANLRGVNNDRTKNYYFFSLAAGTVINYSRVAVISVATGALGQMEVAAFHPPRT